MKKMGKINMAACVCVCVCDSLCLFMAALDVCNCVCYHFVCICQSSCLRRDWK